MENEIRSICKTITETVSPLMIVMYSLKYDLSGEKIKAASFCVVVDGNAQEAEKKLYLALDSEFPCDMLVYNSADFAEFMKDPTSYVSSILSKGVLLYGKTQE